MAWELKKIIILAVILTEVVVGGVIGTVILLDALKQPEIFVRSANIVLVNCQPGGLSTAPIESQYVAVFWFRLANTGEVPGFARVDLYADGQRLGGWTFLVLPGEESVFTVNKTVFLTGCDAQSVSYVIGAVVRA